MSKHIYILDTNVVLTVLRGNALAEEIDARCGLRSSKVRPLISIVTHGELRVLAKLNHWGTAKLDRLHEQLRELVTVDIHHEEVIAAYVEIELFSKRVPRGAATMGKNDVWIAACAKAANATLLTTDKDFDHLKSEVLPVMTFD